jgi:hypothetical protein
MSSESKSIPMPEASRKSILARLRPLILAGVVSAIIMQIVALSPSSVEEARDSSAPIDPSELLPQQKANLAPGIPKGVPEYTVDQFDYVSTHEGIKEWNLLADTAYFYNSARMVHAISVTAYLFDPDGKVTVVTGKEAKYTLAPVPTRGSSGKQDKVADKNSIRDLEVFGNVKTILPDGFEVRSEYMRYKPDLRTVEIPESYAASGHGKDANGQVLGFTSMGMNYLRSEEKIVLPRHVKVTVDQDRTVAARTVGSKEKDAGPTVIASDRCTIDRAKKLAFFTMDPGRPLKDRFVQVRQPTLFSKGRRGELNYGDNTGGGGAQLLHKVALYDDVYVKELGEKDTIRYATGGQANFDSAQDIVILTKFPQVYENEDTVIGDRIILHRDTDVVEVEHSNSFSVGQTIKDQL